MVEFITPTNSNIAFNGARYVEIACLSTDDPKPTGDFLTGSILTEVDTGKVYFYNRAESEWVEQFSFQS